jgi:hypothetical protein
MLNEVVDLAGGESAALPEMPDQLRDDLHRRPVACRYSQNFLLITWRDLRPLIRF